MQIKIAIVALALALVSSSSAFAAGRVAIRADQKVSVPYENKQHGEVDVATMSRFITRTNDFLALKGMTVKNGMDGVKVVTPGGVRVELTNGKGETFGALVKTSLLKNVGAAHQNAPWVLGSEVTEVSHIEKK